MNALEKLLAEHQTLVLDGAMGTMLFEAGLTSGDPPEEWNVTEPDKIRFVHQAYVDAGSNIFLTNSFGGSYYRLMLHKFQDRVYELNKAAAEVGRSVADKADRTVLVAGSLGPTGELMYPMGNMRYEECVAAFAEQSRGLADGGADILWIETMSDLDEVRAAVEGARQVCDLPICATMSFDTKSRTMMGVTGAECVTELSKLNLAAIGVNCGNNLADSEYVVKEMHAAMPEATLICKANAGIPVFVGSDLVYDATPEKLAEFSYRMSQHGARLIGGCCGSSPAHIEMMAKVLSGELPVPTVEALEAADVAPSPGTVDKRPKRGERRRRRSKK